MLNFSGHKSEFHVLKACLAVCLFVCLFFCVCVRCVCPYA